MSVISTSAGCRRCNSSAFAAVARDAFDRVARKLERELERQTHVGIVVDDKESLAHGLGFSSL
jgi:hypothetical protein